MARQLGHRDWDAASATLEAMLAGDLGSAVPVVRVQDETLMREFYLDYLGFTVDWEHRFEPGMPLYARIRRDQLVIDLSEHHGDGTPGSVVWVPVGDLRELHRQLSSKSYNRVRSGIDEQAPGGPTMEVVDPFANVIRFCEPAD